MVVSNEGSRGSLIHDPGCKARQPGHTTLQELEPRERWRDVIISDKKSSGLNRPNPYDLAGSHGPSPARKRSVRLKPRDLTQALEPEPPASLRTRAQKTTISTGRSRSWPKVSAHSSRARDQAQLSWTSIGVRDGPEGSPGARSVIVTADFLVQSFITG